MNNPPHLLPAAFPFFFAGLWLVITTVLGFMSGWFELQDNFPSTDETPLVTLRGRSGSMGLGVGLNGILNLSACPSGLRVGIWRIFGPFQRPFLVPWNKIEVIETSLLFMPMAKLTFGRPSVGTLKINARTWQQLVGASPQAASITPSTVMRAQIGRGALMQWLAISAVAGTFFYFVFRSAPHAPPLWMAALPPAMFGLVLGFQFLRDKW